jgi:hypothetical protein
LYGSSPKYWDFSESEYAIGFIDPKLLNKSAIRFILRWNWLNKILIKLLLIWHLCGSCPKYRFFENLSNLLFWLTPNYWTKTSSDLFYGEIFSTKFWLNSYRYDICTGVVRNIKFFRNLSKQLCILTPNNFKQKYHQMF